MSDMLVKLYQLEQYTKGFTLPADSGISIHPAMAANLMAIRHWISEHFSVGWADEATKAILSSPSHCYLAIKESDNQREIVGFACYDATAKGFFGPTGVSDDCRGMGVGKALLLTILESMRKADTLMLSSEESAQLNFIKNPVVRPL